MLKKISALVVTLALCFALSACGDSGQESGDASGDKIVEMGMLSMANMDQDEMTKRANETNKVLNKDYTLHITYYNSLSEMQMALASGKINNMKLGLSCGEYISAKDTSMKVYNSQDVSESYDYSMMLLKEDKQLCDDISAALEELSADGTLDRLTMEYIDNCKSGEEPKTVELPVFEGAETYTVAVTGDLPPMDFVASDGEPAGFNMALLAAISEKMQVNFETVSIESGARAISLSSGDSDIVFWAISNDEDGADIPEGAIVTAPYFSDSVVIVIPSGDETVY